MECPFDEQCILSTELINYITTFPIPKLNWSDQLDWGLICTKTIKLKDIYFLVNNDGPINQMNIKWVWKLKVPPRVQFFWWKIV